MTPPRSAQNSRQPSGITKEDRCLRLIEALAHDDPVPDTSALFPERKELLSLLAEMSKGERSEFSLQITEVAQRRGIVSQEIAARAAFLLACLDAPMGDNYYTMLGVTSAATPQEIRDAWIRRVSLFHPDRHPAEAHWFTQQAARLNEAYYTLKDPVRRREYDERRREDLERRRRDSRSFRRSQGQARGPLRFGHRWRRRLPTLITGGSVAVAGLMVIGLLLTRPPNRHEATLFARSKIPGPAVEGPSGGEADPSGPRSSGWSQTPHPETPGIQQQPVTASSPPPALRNIQGISERSTQWTLLAQILPPLTPKPKRIERQEIDALLDEYVDAYEKGDVDRLMATFSPKVREKGTLDYHDIRSLYAKGFAGREQVIYRIYDVRVGIEKDHAIVSAQYQISAMNTHRSPVSATEAGQIAWKIRREGDWPKIVAINY